MKIRQIVVCQKSVRKEENECENSRQNKQSQKIERNSRKRNKNIQPNRCHPGLKKEGKAKNRMESLWPKMRHQD